MRGAAGSDQVIPTRPAGARSPPGRDIVDHGISSATDFVKTARGAVKRSRGLIRPAPRRAVAIGNAAAWRPRICSSASTGSTSSAPRRVLRDDGEPFASSRRSRGTHDPRRSDHRSRVQPTLDYRSGAFAGGKVGRAMPQIEYQRISAVHAHALFVSSLQPSEQATGMAIRRAVRATLGRYSPQECAGAVAWEYGEHPIQAAERMAWARSSLAAVRLADAAEPVPSLGPSRRGTGGLRPLADKRPTDVPALVSCLGRARRREGRTWARAISVATPVRRTVVRRGGMGEVS